MKWNETWTAVTNTNTQQNLFFVHGAIPAFPPPPPIPLLKMRDDDEPPPPPPPQKKKKKLYFTELRNVYKQVSTWDVLIFQKKIPAASVVRLQKILSQCLSSICWTQFDSLGIQVFTSSYLTHCMIAWFYSAWFRLFVRLTIELPHPFVTQCISDMKTTLYHTIRNFKDPEVDGFYNILEKSRKCWWTAFSAFPKMLSTRSKTSSVILERKFFSIFQNENI